MAHYSMPEPDADHLQLRSSTKRRLSEIPGTGEAERPNFESDFAALTAKFSSDEGGQLSAELSAELALEVVLNEIVERACQATSASGAGIILQRDGEWVCRASSGSSVPALGARLSRESGLTAECIRTRQIQYCQDAEIDPRADIDACRKLGVRSVIMLPILQNGYLLGVLAAFSRRPSAFGEQDQQALMTLSDYVLSTIAQASEPAPKLTKAPIMQHSSDTSAGAIYAEQYASRGVAAESFPAQLHLEETPLENGANRRADSTMEVEHEAGAASGSREIRTITWMLAATVLALAVLLAILAGEQLLGKRKPVRPHRPTPTSVQAANEPSVPVSQNPAAASSPPNGQTSRTTAPTAEGGLSVYENGKEVFHIGPGAVEAGVSEEQGVEHLPIDQAEGNVIYRVEPEYPEAARRQGIEGPVALYVKAGVDGSVQRVRVISGPPLLADAAVAAVKQWRFKPHLTHGHPAAIETEVVLNFRLPGAMK
jgi:TonB family protein